jgi:hypothetical protein
VLVLELYLAHSSCTCAWIVSSATTHLSLDLRLKLYYNFDGSYNNYSRRGSLSPLDLRLKLYYNFDGSYNNYSRRGIAVATRVVFVSLDL